MSTRAIVAQLAREYVGLPSQPYNKDAPINMDCSGFVCRILELAGIPNPNKCRHCNEFFDRFGVSVHFRHVDYGDLVFFSRNGTVPSHMGIMISPNEYVHSPGRSGKKIGILEIGFKEIPHHSLDQLYDTNPIGFKRISLYDGRYQKILDKM